MIQESPSKTWIPLTVAIIGGTCAIIAAIVSGFAEKIADRMLPPLTPVVSVATPLPESPQQQNDSESDVVINTSQPPTLPPVSNSGVSAQLDTIFGSGNWFCFPDRSDAVGVKVSNEATITSPIIKVDTAIGTYTSGRIPYGGGATVWLSKSVSTDECPSNQLSSITAWRSARSTDTTSFDKSRMDILFGIGNWKCVPSFPYAVTVVNLPSGTAIQYPFTAVDNSSGKYGVGETMSQSGSATVWLAGSISGCQ
jgi:hypothetical protein